MKQKISILILMISFSLFSYSQSIGDYIDVVYLKNGSKIKGIIIEQVPGKTVKIKTKDGSEYVYQVTEVEKFTREEVSVSNLSSKKTEKEDGLKYMDNFKMKRKGYFANIDVLLNSTAVGLRLTNGYRFGRFGNIGIAVGLENINLNFSPYQYIGSEYTSLSLNLVYSGEILNKRITPFYQIEAGYGFAINEFDYNRFDPYYRGDQSVTNYGGPMLASTIGVKFATKRKIFYRISLDARIVSNFFDVQGYYNYDPLSSYVESYSYQEFGANSGIGIRFGIGF